MGCSASKRQVNAVQFVDEQKATEPHVNKIQEQQVKEQEVKVVKQTENAGTTQNQQKVEDVQTVKQVVKQTENAGTTQNQQRVEDVQTVKQVKSQKLIGNDFQEKFMKQINKLKRILADFSLMNGDDDKADESKPKGAMQIKGNKDIVTLEVLGKGGSGSVSKVFHQGIKKFLALKTQIVDDDADATDFTELEILAELAVHSNNQISKVLGVEVYQSDQQLEYQLLSELGECSFEHIVQAKKKLGVKWTQTQLLYILKSICEPLNFLYSLKIAHRDLKPHNVVIESDLVSIKLIDFGISVRTKLDSNGKMNCIMAGTPYYLPPEAIPAMENDESEIYCNPYKWDSYSLGKTMVGMIDIDAVKSDELLAEAVNDMKSQYPNLYSIVSKLLDKVPENRPGVQEVLKMVGDVKLDKLVTVDEFDFVVKKLRMKNVKGSVEDVKKLAAFYLKIADFKNAYAYLESLISKYEDDDTQLGMQAQLNLLMGKTLYFSGQYEKANEYLSNSLRVYLTDLDTDVVESTEPLIYLARLNQELGERKKAINYIERAYNIRKENLGEDHLQTIETTNFYLQFIVVNKQKEDLWPKLLAVIEKAHENPEIKDTEIGGKALEVYGFYKLRKKEYDLALKYYEQAQQVYKKVLGDNSLQMANILYRIGYYYQERSQYDKSKELYLKCKEIRIKLLGEEHPLIGDIYSGLGWLFYRTNNSVECSEAFNKCKQLYEQAYGEKSLITASAYYSVGVVKKWYRQYAECETYLKKCYEIKKEKLGENHSELSACCVVLGNLNNEQSKYEEARTYYELGLKIALENKEELDQAFNLYNLGDLHYKACEYEEAVEKLEKTYEIRKRILGNDDNLTLFTIKFMNDSKLRLGKVEEAIEAITVFVKGQTKIFGKESNSTSWAHWYRAYYYYDIGHYSQSIDDCERAQKTLSTNTLVRTQIAKCQLQLGEFDKSFKEINICLESRKKGFADKSFEYGEYYIFYCQYYLEKQNYVQVHAYATELAYIPKSKVVKAKYHELYAESYYYHGLAYLKENKMDLTLENLENALQQANKIYYKDTIFCSKYNTALGQYYLAINEPLKARSYVDRAIKALEGQNIMTKTQFYGNALFVLAQTYLQEGDKDKYQSYTEKALTAYRNQFSEQHPKINQVLSHLKQHPK